MSAPAAISTNTQRPHDARCSRWSSALPVEVLRRILALADATYRDAPYPHTPALPMELLRTLAQVSRGFRGAVEEIVTEHRLQTLAFDISTGDHKELEHLEAALVTRQHKLCSLRLGIMPERAANGWSDPCAARQRAHELDTRLTVNGIDWKSIFAQCPNLWRLDLSGIGLHSSHLCRILDAASTHCPRLQALLMPQNEWFYRHAGIELSETFAMLQVAIARWGGAKGRRHFLGHDQGLRQLVVPEHGPLPTDAILLDVAELCPQIRHLDAPDKETVYVDDGHLVSTEFWGCSRETWRRFCRQRPHLRSLNWLQLPFTMDFMRIFAQQRWDGVEALTMGRGCEYNGMPMPISEGGEQLAYTECIELVLSSCPRLRELRVVFHNDLVDSLRPTSLFGDDLLKAVGRRCQHLEVLTIEDVGAPNVFTGALQVSDEGIEAIASIPELCSLRLTGSRCGADGIWSLLAHSPKNGSYRRHCDLEVGIFDNDAVAQKPHRPVGFHELLFVLLQRLLASSHELAGRRFHVTLRNESLWPQGTEQETARLEMLIAHARMMLGHVVDIHVRLQHRHYEAVLASRTPTNSVLRTTMARQKHNVVVPSDAARAVTVIRATTNLEVLRVTPILAGAWSLLGLWAVRGLTRMQGE